MRANPGGTIDPQDVVGRDALIDRLWKVLKRQSVVLVAERRMGKTCVTAKMKAEPRGDILTVWQDVEGFRSPLEFVEAVFQQVEGYLGRLERTAVKARKLLAELSGAEVAGVKLPAVAAAHWKTVLTETMEDLADHQDRLVVFFWDELPLMLKNIRDRQGEDAAMELLDVLRAIRQTHKRVRMFFTGSIGLHNVLTALRRAGHANAPINDMHGVDLPPLAPPDAADLARRLLDGEGIGAAPDSPLPDAIAESVECIPFYIHHVVDQMSRRRTEPTSQAVRQLVTACLTDDQDLWELRHYRERIDVYYEDEQDRRIALALLDVLAGADGPLDFAEALNLLKSEVVTEDRERVRELLTLLRRDHYAAQDPDGRYRFRYGLIQRWWRLHRGLTR